LVRKTLVSLSHVVINPNGRKCSHPLTLSLSDNGNKRRQIASVEASLVFKVSHTSKNIERCKFGSFIGEPLNRDCWTIEMSASLSSKLLAVTGGIVMPEV